MLESVAATTNATLGALISQALPHEIGGRRALIDRFGLKIHLVNVAANFMDDFLMVEKVNASKQALVIGNINYPSNKQLFLKVRDAYQQAGVGEAVGFLQETQCGDLAYFDNEEGRITHVGILFSQDTIIHASGKVRIDKIDNMGIVNGDTSERTHKLRLIKRYF